MVKIYDTLYLLKKKNFDIYFNSLILNSHTVDDVKWNIVPYSIHELKGLVIDIFFVAGVRGFLLYTILNPLGYF